MPTTFVVKGALVPVVDGLLIFPNEGERAQSTNAISDIIDTLEHAVLQPKDWVKFIVNVSPFNIQDVVVDLDALKKHFGLFFKYHFWRVKQRDVSQVDT